MKNKLLAISMMLVGTAVGCSSYTPVHESAVRYYDQHTAEFSRIYSLSRSIDHNFQVDVQLQPADTSLYFMGNNTDIENTARITIGEPNSSSIVELLDSLNHKTSNWIVSIDVYDQHLHSILKQQDSEMTKKLYDLLNQGISDNSYKISKQQGVVMVSMIIDHKLVDYFIYHDPNFSLPSKENVTVQSDIYISEETLHFATGKINDTISYRILKN